jgi:hypothetical protein
MKDVLQKNKSSYLKTSTPVYPNKLRSLLNLVLNSTPSLLNISNCDKNGEITFSVLLKEVNLTYEDIKEFKDEIFSNYFADLLGELLVRENINSFAEKITDIDSSCINTLLNTNSHFRFGMKTFGDRFEFAFHVTLLQNILTEDFKRQFWK